NRLYGGSVTQFSQSIKRFGWEARFVDIDQPGQISRACNKRTKAIFCESIANPGGHIADLPRIASIAERKGLPLIVDNTSATPYLCRPFEHGATLVVHSTTKYLCGHGAAMGGMVVDSGTFDWSASGRYPSLSEAEPAYHGLKFHESFGALAFTLHSHAVGLRDLGMCQSPQDAFITMLGVETLSLRMEKHVANAVKVAQWLEADPRVEAVTYAGLKSNPTYKRMKKICPKGAGSLFTVAIKGGYDACVKTVDALELFSHVANLGDARSLVIHSASTTHRQLSAEQREAAGAADNVIRLSIGIEDADDLIADLDQALSKATAMDRAA
ncbi:MAG: PLP-dependent transferase, partial [Pseudomonadota bacterium]